MEGFVYILSNESMNGIYKIGYTTRHPIERAEELFTTGVPSKFIVEYYVYVVDCVKLEKIIHENLKEYNCGKEFFKTDLIDCISQLKNIANKIFDNNFYESYKSDNLRLEVKHKLEAKPNVDNQQRVIIIDKFWYR